MAKSYELCKIGHNQSPIDISRHSKVVGITKISYKESLLQVIDNGHTLQVNFGPDSFVTIDSQIFQLVQMHYHSTSEHTVNGISYPLEFHLVHKDAKGNLAVLGALVELGDRNPEVDKIIHLAPKTKNVPNSMSGVNINPNEFLPREKSVYRYTGSLTTPPCSEGVNWNVFAQTITMSADQIAALKGFYGKNNRPVQDLNSRQIGVMPGQVGHH